MTLLCTPPGQLHRRKIYLEWMQHHGEDQGDQEYPDDIAQDSNMSNKNLVSLPKSVDPVVIDLVFPYATSDLRRWKDRSIKALRERDAKRLVAPFKTDYISDRMKTMLVSGLQAAQTADEIKQIFNLKATPIASWRPWSSFESEIQAAMEDAFTFQIEKLKSEILTQMSLDPLLSAATWEVQKAALLTVLQPILTQLVAFGVQRVKNTLGNSGLMLDWSLVNQDAVDWAAAHSAELVTEITDTTRTAVQQAVADSVTSGEGVTDLASRLSNILDAGGNPLFSFARSKLIAQTEATTSFANSNNLAWASAGYAKAVFLPGRDSHPNCRCWPQPYTLDDGTKVIVWYTADDEKVCEEPLDTPWGTVLGCRDLHGVVISEGDHLGEQVELL